MTDAGPPIARFKDLSVDATQPAVLGEFWSRGLGRTWRPHDDGDGQVDGPTPQHTIWVDAVPEPKTVKHRVHLDIYVRTLDELTALGASSVEPFPRWTIMADPEGGEFCAFLRDPVPAERLHGLVVDSADPIANARWWAGVYGARLDEKDGWATLEDVPGMPILTMDFVPVPEPKTAKNRVHWDVVGDTRALLERGATLLRARDDEIRWDVLADPEGNEFCVFAAGA
ncbi:VOC family protein [uncultured Jatrophihabitans sp.]|uniref:VOC family protein n=1 Tax=uncultured Jatrophihabitans sp. TaxID=1610747 RepID=UPI0035CA5297